MGRRPPGHREPDEPGPTPAVNPLSVTEDPPARVGVGLEGCITSCRVCDVGGFEFVRSLRGLDRGVQHRVGLCALLLIESLGFGEIVSLRRRAIAHEIFPPRSRRRVWTAWSAFSDRDIIGSAIVITSLPRVVSSRYVPAIIARTALSELLVCDPDRRARTCEN